MMRRGTILLVDDNPDDVELTVRAFDKIHLPNRVVVARDGEEALGYLLGTGSHSERDLSAVPEVIFLDLNLPKVGGLQVLERIRADERTRLIPVVILTSSRERGDIVRSYALGASGFVRKPVDFVAFVEAARQLGAYWLALNEPPPQPGGGE